MRALRCLCLISIFVLTVAARAGAQEPRLQVAVFPVGAETTLTREVDGELLRILAEVVGVQAPVLSPIDYADARLSVGCSDHETACFEPVARMAGVNALMLRRIEDGQLELTYFDRSAPEEPITAHGPLGQEGSVEAVVRNLFGLPEAVVVPRDPEPGSTRDASASGDQTTGPAVVRESMEVGPLSWISLGVGAVALSLGAVFRVLADESYQEYTSIHVASQRDADRANELLDRADSRATVGTAFLVGGGIALGAGIILLIIDLTGDSDEQVPSVSLSPALGGGTVSLAGTFGGRQ